MYGRAFVAALLSLAGLTTAVSIAHADRTGTVFVDLDGDGARGEGEVGRAGVVVSNGREVVTTDANGRYRLPEPPHGLVAVTCPADASCPVWFRRLGGEDATDGSAEADFGLVPAPIAEDFFFVHLSDAHVYPDVEDMAALLPASGLPWYLPRVVAGWLLLFGLDWMYPHHEKEVIVAVLREIVSEHRDVSDAWDSTVMMDYVELALDPKTGIIDPAVEIPRAFAEIESLAPAFAINTGDMVLEGNEGEPEAFERWYAYYTELVSGLDLKIYETIGNNDLGGTSNNDFTSDDPRYGKVLYRREFGPTRYSFDRGTFHFVAVDTHKPLFDLADLAAEEEWTFYEMNEDVRAWLEADLARARGADRRIVVLNHEPFYTDPVWGFHDPTPAQDDGLLDRYDVAYELSGHIHRNGFEDAPPGGGVTHITTGALSGFRWALPPAIDSRGYRLFYAHEGELFSAWKELGKPLLGFVDPRGDAAHHPASTHAAAPDALDGVVEVVAVGVDVDRPFESLSLWLDDEPLEAKRWGDFFVHAHFDAASLSGQDRSGQGRLELRAVARDGRAWTRSLELSRADSSVGDASPTGGG